MPRPKTFVYLALTHTCGHSFNGMCQERDKPYWLSTCEYECGDCLNVKDEQRLHLQPLTGTYLERYAAGRLRLQMMNVLEEIAERPGLISCTTTTADIHKARARMANISESAWWILNCLSLQDRSTVGFCIKSSKRWRPPKPNKQVYSSGTPQTNRDAEALELIRGDNG